MPRQRPEFTYGSADTSRIPDAFVEAASLLIELQRRDIVKTLGERLRIRRQGGFPALDVVLLLLVYFASGARRGLRLEWEHIGPHKASIAALVGRKSLPSPPAISRALAAVEPDLIREGTGWLLGEACGIDTLMMHPASATWDACGGPWHLFDLDPTVTSLRHRALPEADDLPAPQRRSEDTGAPGYSGRKRGDIQLRRVTVQHAGSAAWIHAHLSPGNGEGLVDLELGLDAVAATCDRLGVERSQALMRMDGEFGHVPAMTACRERGLPVLVRINRASLYEDAGVLARLRGAEWRPVADSLSGPRRFAAELGSLTLPPGETTRRPDGSEYEPVTIRAVASVYRVPKDKPGRGKVFDGWRVELFAADLPADAWPAEDCVSTYLGRSAEENRFAQEDRELGLDRILSYHLPGQELAAAVGLFVWNLRLVHGFEAEQPPAEAPVLRLRADVACSDGPPKNWPPDPVLVRQLGKLDGDTLLAQRPGWSLCPAEGGLRCPEGRALGITCVPERAPDAALRGVIFRRPTGGCEDCSSRPSCYHTVRALGAKHVELSLPAKIATAVAARLPKVRGARKEGPIRRPAPGPLAVTPPMMLPAEARAAHLERLVGATLHVALHLPAAALPRPRLVAINEGFKQRRRKTWQQRIDDYALPAGARVSVHVEGSIALRAFLGEQVRPRRHAAGDAEKPS